MRALAIVMFLFVLSAVAQNTFPALLSDKPGAKHSDQLMLFGQFVGSWSYEGTDLHDDGTRTSDKGEIHFHWILQGTAIQDVWMEKKGDAPPRPYGTTIRFYDSKSNLWRVTWISPENGVVFPMTANRKGTSIVLEGTNQSGTLVPWIFSDIKSDSFHWHAEKLVGNEWRTYEDLIAKRINKD